MSTVVRIAHPIKDPMPIYQIPSEWILEGQPDSRGCVLIESTDGRLGCGKWRCTPGKFRWEYSFDEFIFLLEGEVIIIAEGEQPVTLRAGDTAHFQSGTVAIWNVISTVEKVFFYRNS